MPAELSTDWRGAEILLRRSRGISGVPYVEDWRRNVIGNTRDAPPFLIRQVRAYVAHSRWFTDEDAAALSADLGRISKVQSLRSEDAITWSWFGTLAAADPRRRASTLRWLYGETDIQASVSTGVSVSQWSRVAHPNAVGRTGPEVDAIIDDPAGALIYVEAKWDAALGTGRGTSEGTRDDQVVLRQAVLQGRTGDPRPRAVLVVSRVAHDVSIYDRGGVPVKWTTWATLANCPHHPHAAEYAEYLSWKERLAEG